MAMHYSANQYEISYKPKLLRNWEVPKNYKCNKPKTRKGFTQVVANDKGHLLPGVPRSKNNPWGNQVCTWDLPKKIDRKTADQLSGLPQVISCEEKRRLKEEKLRRQTQKAAELREEIEQIEQAVREEEAREAQSLACQQEQTGEIPALKEDKNQNTYPYVPGDFTDDPQRLPSHEILAQNRYNNQEKLKSNGYPRYREDFTKPLPQIEKPLSRNEVEEEYQNHKIMTEENYTSDCKNVKTGSKKTNIIDAIKNFQLAKKLHRENLEHDPLPDTLTHSKYCKLQMQRASEEPGLALENENYATGVGWKGYPGYGPTRCTKFKVYRPKTCGHKDKQEIKNDGRPSSVTSFDKRWRFIRRRKVSPIELAICWDLTPENPSDEPKRTPHIDGSNGSLAPAVFSLVHTPKEEPEEKESRKSSISTNTSAPLFEKRPIKTDDEKDFVLDRPKTTNVKARRVSRGSSQSSDSLKKRAKSAYNLNNNQPMKDTCQQCVIHQSTPNLSDCDKRMRNARLCMACELKNVSLKDKKSKKDEYKMAFKAGVPQKSVSNDRDARCKLIVPKQKDPYSPKNYKICSLAPPFSLQKDKRQDYPEHWRLATVYQHSYKPIHTRKRPLLATVFK